MGLSLYVRNVCLVFFANRFANRLKKTLAKKKKQQPSGWSSSGIEKQRRLTMDGIGVVCALTAALLFANTWQGDFVYDDRWVICTRPSSTPLAKCFLVAL